VCPARLGLEVEDGDEGTVVANIQLFLGYTLGNDICVVVDADHGVIAVELSEELVATGFVDADFPAFLLARELGFCNQGLDEVINITALGDEDIVVVLVV